MKIRSITLAGKWTGEEASLLSEILAPLPRAWVEGNPSFVAVRREQRISNPPPGAPGHSKYDPKTSAIVVFDKGVYHGKKIDGEQFRRSIYHELAHSILRNDPSILRQWTIFASNDGYVDDYAKTSPEEDFCDTFSEFLIDPLATTKRVPTKALLIRQLREHADREKVAMSFFEGFTNEITKTAKPSIKRILEAITKTVEDGGASRALSPIAKALVVGGGAGSLGAVAGLRRGKKEGYSEGTSDVMSVARRARIIGRREGVLAYHRALMAQRARANRG